MKDLQKIKEFFSKSVNEAIATPMDAIEFLNANKNEIIKLADQYKGDVSSMQKAIDAFLAPHIDGTPDFIVNKIKAAIGGAISKRNISANPELSATYDKLKNVKGVVNEESPTQFKKGDKITYLGHPGEITAVNKEMTGEITYSVAYDKGQGRTKSSNINLKSGAIKPLKEAKTAVDMVKKKLDALGVKVSVDVGVRVGVDVNVFVGVTVGVTVLVIVGVGVGVGQTIEYLTLQLLQLPFGNVFLSPRLFQNSYDIHLMLLLRHIVSLL